MVVQPETSLFTRLILGENMKSGKTLSYIITSYFFLMITFAYESPQPFFLIGTAVIQSIVQGAIHFSLSDTQRSKNLAVYRSIVYMIICPL